MGRELVPEEIRAGTAYETVRGDERSRIAALQRYRRVSLGRVLSLVFQNRETRLAWWPGRGSDGRSAPISDGRGGRRAAGCHRDVVRRWQLGGRRTVAGRPSRSIGPDVRPAGPRAVRVPRAVSG